MNSEKVKILLLTNRDSDNTGDQVIEACDISLVSAVMENLGFSEEEYEIKSRACSIVNKAYVASKKPELLETARRAIRESDLVIFGGAPVFNYTYQIFSERTAITLDLCKEYSVPVIFSGVGIEYFNPKNEKCRRITEAVNYDVVRQITTRDDFESLKKMKRREDLVIGKVSDPAVFSAEIFEKFADETDFLESKHARNIGKKDSIETESMMNSDVKKIGLFVLRAGGFTANGNKLPWRKAARFWMGLIHELESRGYDYEVLTSGNFGDEAFVDRLIRDYGLDTKKAVFNVNAPEDMVGRIYGYDGIISCRLHPNICAYSAKVPALGLLWNMKVQGFYDSIGYGNRVLSVKEMEPAYVVDALEKAMEEGVLQNEAFRMSVYETLYSGIKNALEYTKKEKADGDVKSSDNKASDNQPSRVLEKNSSNAYGYEELLERLPRFQGTSKKERRNKTQRKFRRIYEKYNSYSDLLKTFQSKKGVRFIFKKWKKYGKKSL